jgi:quercetin dioxygenase-like cupin family protein
MKYSLLIFLITACFTLTDCTKKPDSADTATLTVAEAAITELELISLLKDTLHLASGLEVIVSHVKVPPNMALPAHYHPGEEFAYLMKGSGRTVIGDQPPMEVYAGTAVKIPYKTEHSFESLDEGAEMIVFRVHEKGQPERILVDQ